MAQWKASPRGNTQAFARPRGSAGAYRAAVLPDAPAAPAAQGVLANPHFSQA
jgi:hypothetical protein